ncbi:MAG TPA: protease pro-enzyme activation domain-containing protein [Candidatus Acidoferrales bacterium]|nr:protease pro-enzyme activation domain-containing protein [Candidatus Acidoferrales bacterium]
MRSPSSLRLRVSAVLLVALSFGGLTSLLRADRKSASAGVSEKYSLASPAARPAAASSAPNAPVIYGTAPQPAKVSTSANSVSAPLAENASPVSEPGGNSSPAPNPAPVPQNGTFQVPPARALVTDAVNDSILVSLSNTVHPLARAEFDQGPAPADLPMRRILLVLNRSSDQEAALDQLLNDQQNPNSPNYKNWLTPDQFGQMFGPADSDIQAVTGWLGSHGFQIGSVSHGKTVIEFSGTASQVQEAFHTEIHKFTVNGQDHWANTSDPQIPAALAPVIKGFATLHNFLKHPTHHVGGIAKLPKPLDQLESVISGKRVTGSLGLSFGPNAPRSPQSNPFQGGPPSKIVPNYEFGGTHAMVPGDFATIYNVAPLWAAGIDGTGQTIGIVGRTDLNVSDVHTFRSLLGLPANDPVIVVNGVDPGDLGAGENTEAQLDAEWSGAVAKGATVKFVESESTESTDGVDLSALYIVDNNLAGQMSTSFGNCEVNTGSDNQFFSKVWQQAAAQGITAFVSSSDEGSAACDDGTGTTAVQFGLAVNGLASTPYNIAVGGTGFDTSVANYSSTFWNPTNNASTQASAKSYIPEVPWNNSCAEAGLTGCSGAGHPNVNGFDRDGSGGGQSGCATGNPSIQSVVSGSCAGYPKPVWQSGTGVPADGVRDLPDVSLFADFLTPDSYYFLCASESTGTCTLTNFVEVGGTSASSPSFAGIMALVNHYQASISANARQGNANYIFYPLAAVSGNSCNSSLPATITNTSCVFYDITKGNNSVICFGTTPNCSSTTGGVFGVLVEPTATTTPAWQTTTGYDLATGLGSVNVFNLAHQWGSVALGVSSTTLNLNGGTSAVNITHGASVSVSGAVTGVGTPGGQVSLMSSAATGSGITDFALSGGSYSGSTTLFPGGSYTVTSHYNGDGTNGASNSSPAISMTVGKENSTTVITIVDFTTQSYMAGNPTIPYGSNYFIRVDVGNSAGSLCQFDVFGFRGGPTAGVGCPTGAINPTNNGTPEGNYPLNSQGYAEAQSAVLGGGVNALQANYTGDNSYNSSFGNMTVTITKATTTAFAGDTSNAITFGNSDTLTAIIATSAAFDFSNPPSGTVQFFVNGTAFGTPVSVTGTGSSGGNSGATAQLVTSALPPGTDNITAQYSGDNNYAQSAVSGPTPITVSDATPVITPPLVPSSTTAGSGGFTLTVNGSGFAPNSVVSFGGTNRVTTFVNGTQVTAAILASDVASAGTPAVVVTNPAPGGGTSNSVNFTVTTGSNPVPVITPPLVPAAATAGSAGFTLTVNGTGFVNASVVSFGGANRTTTFVNATQVTAAILASDIATAGTPAVVVTNPLPGGGASNSVNFTVNNPVPVITPPLVPAAAIVGGPGFSLTVNGTGFVAGSTATFAGTARAVTFVNSTQVTIAVLAGDIATTGAKAVVVSNPAPGGGASNSVNFNVNNPVPVITPPLVPVSAIVGGAGFTLTVNGTGFVNGATATFGGVARAVTFVNATQVTIAVQASDIAATGTPAVVVTNPAPGGGASNSVNFNVNNPVPVITPPLVPASAAAGSPGFSLTVNGTGFVNGATATFGGVSRVVTFVNATQITIAVLAGDIASVGTPPVVVTNPAPGGGASNSVNFNVTAANNPVPVITPPLVPANATAGSAGFTLTVNGTGFVNASVVSFGGTNRVTTFVSATQITAAILATDIATAGTPAVVATNPAPGGGASNSVNFTVNNPVPVITPPLVPASATVGGPGFTLTVNGSGFINGATATFGGNARVVTFVNATQVTIAVLAADIAVVGTPAVVVTNPGPGGGASNSVNFAVNNPPPVITPPLVPANAIAGQAGFTLTVNGSGFISGAVVNFGGAAKVTTFVSATQVTAAILASDIATAGTPAVTVTNPAPGGGTSNSVNFTVNNPLPVITPPLVPANAIAGGAGFTLTVNGSSFVNGAVVSFGGTARVTTFVNATQVTAAILAADIATAGTPAVVVTNPGPGGGASNSVNFTVNNPVPVITPPLVPASATVGGPGFSLTVNGTGFVNGATATFGGTARVVTFVNATQVTIAVLAGDIAAVGTPAVVVTNPGPGGGASNSVNFAVNNPPPVITPPLVPANAIAGSAGFTLTINGTAFINGAVVSFGGNNRVTTFVNATQVTAAILAGDIATAGTPAVTVTNPAPGGGTSNSVNFTVNNPVPVITPPLVPVNAIAGGAGFTLTINGTGFVNGAVVSFGGAAKVTTFVSATQVTAAILAADIATAGTPAVIVTNPVPGGGASNSVNFTVNNPVPVITPPLVPASVAINSGAFTLTVNGTGFVNGSVVSFGGANRVTTFVSATKVTAAILATDITTIGTPAVVVTNPGPGGGASNSVNINVVNPVPVIVPPLVPASVATNSGAFTLTINGTGFVNGAVVSFGGAAKVTTFVSATQVTAAILAGDVTTVSTPAVVVTNPGPGGGASNSVNFNVVAPNPVPVITPPLVPATTTAGSAAFTLTVNGTGFVSGATVSFAGANRATTFVSATQVTAAILASDVSASGTAAVVVTNPAPGGGASNSVNFIITDFSVVNASGGQTVTAGQVATYTINVSGVGGNFPGTVTLSASGSPALGASDITAGFMPGSVTPGSGTSPSTLTLTTTVRTSGGETPFFKGSARPGLRPILLWTLAAFMLLSSLLVVLKTSRSRRPATIGLAAILLLGAVGVAGCNSAKTVTGTPAGTYTITVTGTSGSVTHTTTVSLTVQ